MASCALSCQQRINGKVVSMLTEKAFWTHCTFGKHRKGTRLLAFLLTISLSPTLCPEEHFGDLAFKGLSTNQRSHLQAALNAEEEKCLNCFYQGFLRQGAKGIEASWALLLISGQLENYCMFWTRLWLPAHVHALELEEKQHLAEGARSKIEGPGQKVSKWLTKPWVENFQFSKLYWNASV